MITTTNHGRVRILLIDNPPVNALADGVPEALFTAIDLAESDPGVAAIVLGATGRTFVAGADLNLLERVAWGDTAAKPLMKPLLNLIEQCSKPFVVAIHGTALGGGLELAMAGHFRIAHATAQLGLPEVNLGIIPGADGTQRLPRLIGVQAALEHCVSGRPMRAPAALAVGLIDRITDGDLLTEAIAFAETLAASPRTRRISEERERLGSAEANAPLFAEARALAAKIRSKQTAPAYAIEAIEAATTLPFAEGSVREDEIFDRCVATEQAKALIHVFFAERAVGKVPGLDSSGSPRAVERVAIVGAGTMGGGIAMACANVGIAVRLIDTSQEGLDKGITAIRKNYGSSVKKGRMSEADVDARLARIQPQTDLTAIADADVIIEAVFEDLALKTRLFRDLDAAAGPEAVLATNTSTLDIDAIANATSRPGSVVGLHFFSPANVMRLVEIVRGSRTDAAIVSRALAFAKRVNKLPVVVQNGPGFAGNRMMFPYMYETQFIVEEGSTPAEVDKTLTDFGMAMGMFAVDDMAGIDVAWRVRQAMGHFSKPGEQGPLVQTELYELGRWGQKSGRGWYRYGDDRRPQPDDEVIALIRESARAAGIPQRQHTSEEIIERAIYSLVNEGARVLADGTALRASDLDIIYVNGYGFPAWRGGPMFYADRVGLPQVLARIKTFEGRFGDRWRPAPLLEQLVAEGRTFRDLDRGTKR